MELTVIGARETVTGSKSIVKTDKTMVLIDSGLYQGEFEEKNIEVLSFDVKKLDCIFLTHAHLDHSGFLPVLVKLGFRGKVFCTEQTLKLIKIILEDALKIQQEKIKEHKLKETLFEPIHLEKLWESISVIQKDEDYQFRDIFYRFYEAGHILGASSVVIRNESMSIGFSGDIGRHDDLIHLKPEVPQNLDYLVLESTYGGKCHKEDTIIEDLKNEVSRIIGNEGVLVIPAFAIARAQMMMVYLHEFFKKYPKLRIPIYFDSPMAIKATDVYLDYISSTKMDKPYFEKVLKDVKFSRYESIFDKVRKKKTPFILLSSSGMLSGGIIMKYLDMYIKHEKNTILFTGFQAPGTLGHKLLSGEMKVHLNGHDADVRARLVQLTGLSAHADQDELKDYVCKSKSTLRKVFLNHGEAESKELLKNEIEKEFEVLVEIPDTDMKYELG